MIACGSFVIWKMFTAPAQRRTARFWRVPCARRPPWRRPSGAFPAPSGSRPAPHRPLTSQRRRFSARPDFVLMRRLALGVGRRNMPLLRFCGRDNFARHIDFAVIMSQNVSIVHMTLHLYLQNGINRIGTNTCCYLLR